MTDQCPRCPHPLHQHHACTARNGGTANPCPCLGSQAPEPTSVAPATAAAFMGCFGGYVEVGKARSERRKTAVLRAAHIDAIRKENEAETESAKRKEAEARAARTAKNDAWAQMSAAQTQALDALRASIRARDTLAASLVFTPGDVGITADISSFRVEFDRCREALNSAGTAWIAAEAAYAAADTAHKNVVTAQKARHAGDSPGWALADAILERAISEPLPSTVAMTEDSSNSKGTP